MASTANLNHHGGRVNEQMKVLVAGFVRQTTSIHLTDITTLCLRFYQHLLYIDLPQHPNAPWTELKAGAFLPRWLDLDVATTATFPCTTRLSAYFRDCVTSLTQCISDEYQIMVLSKSSVYTTDYYSTFYGDHHRECLCYDIQRKYFCLMKAQRTATDLETESNTLKLMVSGPVALNADSSNIRLVIAYGSEPWNTCTHWLAFSRNLWQLFVSGRLYDAHSPPVLAQQHSLYDVIRFLSVLCFTNEESNQCQFSSLPTVLLKISDIPKQFVDEEDDHQTYQRRHLAIPEPLTAQIYEEIGSGGGVVECEERKCLKCRCYVQIYSSIYCVSFALAKLPGNEPTMRWSSPLVAQYTYTYDSSDDSSS